MPVPFMVYASGLAYGLAFAIIESFKLATFYALIFVVWQQFFDMFKKK